jgi:hypothetical protein
MCSRCTTITAVFMGTKKRMTNIRTFIVMNWVLNIVSITLPWFNVSLATRPTPRQSDIQMLDKAMHRILLLLTSPLKPFLVLWALESALSLVEEVCSYSLREFQRIADKKKEKSETVGLTIIIDLLCAAMHYACPFPYLRLSYIIAGVDWWMFLVGKLLDGRLKVTGLKKPLEGFTP